MAPDFEIGGSRLTPIEVHPSVAIQSNGRSTAHGRPMRGHAHRAYGAASMPPEVRAASRIAEIIKTEGLRKIGTREIQRRGLSGLQSAKEIRPAFAVLQEANWIRPIPISGTGRPAKLYAVNPKVECMK
jgi:hypothetical protein